ncbi:hypothetical protein SAMN00790413_05927 [Deinococcus hopiensis KR-140]|uniref:Uncharacterized protein n=2 Tax=Deinococcus TaxID=1298 RepID=A0A1W1VVP5_9DEIO|nr:hypothetical protein SAMN00790413_05927 [Deinococcus hopiensis KR-140]
MPVNMPPTFRTSLGARSDGAAPRLRMKIGKAELHEAGPTHKHLKIKPGKDKLGVQADG